MTKTYVNTKAITRRERKAMMKKVRMIKKVQFFLFAVYIKTIKAKLGISVNTRDGNFEVTARAIYNGLLANVGGFYTPPFAQMAALNTAIITFTTEKQNVKDGVAGAEAAKKAAKKAVMVLLQKALNYINELCLDDQKNANEIITGCKMIVVNGKRKDKQELTVKPGLAAGEMLLYSLALRLDGKYIPATYYWQFSIDDGKTWEDLANTMEAKAVATGMLAGLPTLFRKRT